MSSVACSREYAECSLQQGVCRVQHAAGSMQSAACRSEYAECSMQQGVCRMQHAAGSMQSSACSREYAECSMQQGVRRVQHAAGTLLSDQHQGMGLCSIRLLGHKLNCCTKSASEISCIETLPNMCHALLCLTLLDAFKYFPMLV